MSKPAAAHILQDDAYDDAREDTLWSMASQFYGKRMRSTAILVWTIGLVFMALTAAALVVFFQVETVRSQILHAALFVCGVRMVGLPILVEPRCGRSGEGWGVQNSSSSLSMVSFQSSRFSR